MGCADLFSTRKIHAVVVQSSRARGPQGGELAARLHVARTVCRRAERRAAALVRQKSVEPAVQVYLNRLSNLLFVAARIAAKAATREETIYQKPKNPKS